MMIFLNNENKQYLPAGLGWEIGDPSRIFPTFRREHFRIHYITGGMGWLKTAQSRYCLTEGLGFVIFPGEAFGHYPMVENPWEYFWMGIKGKRIEELVAEKGITRGNPIFSTISSQDAIRSLLAELVNSQILCSSKSSRFPQLIENFFTQIAPLNLSEKNQSQYIEDALKFIHANYAKKITVQCIADALFINRSYLYKLFVSIMNTSPQKYILDYRIRKACEMIISTDFPLSKIASDVGISDFSAFYRQFRKRTGKSPTEYRLINNNLAIIQENAEK